MEGFLDPNGLVPRPLTEVERDSLPTQNGMMIFNSTADEYQVYINGWTRFTAVPIFHSGEFTANGESDKVFLTAITDVYGMGPGNELTIQQAGTYGVSVMATSGSMECSSSYMFLQVNGIPVQDSALDCDDSNNQYSLIEWAGELQQNDLVSVVVSSPTDALDLLVYQIK